MTSTLTSAAMWLRRSAGWWILTATVGVIVVLPLVRLQLRALDDGGSAYRQLAQAPNLLRVLGLTAVLAAGAVAIALVLGVSLAWAASRLPARVRALAVVPLIPLMVPIVATVVGWAFLFTPRVGYGNTALRAMLFWSDAQVGPFNVYSVPWIILVTGLVLVTYVYLFCYSSLSRMDASLVESARISGAGPLRSFLTVQLPVLRPALFFSGMIVLLIGLGQFTAPLLLGRQANADVITTEMYRAVQSFPIDWGLAAAYGSPLILAGAVLVVIQRRSLRHGARFEVSGVRGGARPLRTTYWAAVPLVLYGFVAVVLPISALLIVALSPFWSGTVEVDTLGAQNFASVLGNSDARDAIRNSLVYAFTALAILLPVCYLCAAMLASRSRGARPLRGLMDSIVSVPLSMPAIIFGAGVLFAVSQGPVRLYGTGWALITAYVILGVPFLTRMILTGMLATGGTYMEASRVSGASALRSHWDVSVPMLKSTFGAGSAIVLALLTQEFGASVMVRTTRTEVMGTLLYTYWSSGYYPEVAVMALVMCAVTTCAVLGALILAGRNALARLL